MTVRAGPYIASTIKMCQGRAAIYREKAASLREEAARLDALAAQADQDAARWAAGTDFVIDGESAPDLSPPRS